MVTAHDEALVAEHSNRLCNVEDFVKTTRSNFIMIALVIVVQIIAFAYMWGQLCTVVNAHEQRITRNTELLDNKILPHVAKGEIYMNDIDRIKGKV